MSAVEIREVDVPDSNAQFNEFQQNARANGFNISANVWPEFSKQIDLRDDRVKEDILRLLSFEARSSNVSAEQWRLGREKVLNAKDMLMIEGALIEVADSAAKAYPVLRQSLAASITFSGEIVPVFLPKEQEEIQTLSDISSYEQLVKNVLLIRAYKQRLDAVTALEKMTPLKISEHDFISPLTSEEFISVQQMGAVNGAIWLSNHKNRMNVLNEYAGSVFRESSIVRQYRAMNPPEAAMELMKAEMDAERLEFLMKKDREEKERPIKV